MSLQKFMEKFFCTPDDSELPPFLAKNERKKLRGIIHFKGGATTLLQWKKYLGDISPQEIQSILSKNIGSPTELVIRLDKDGHFSFNVVGRDEGHNYLFLAKRDLNLKNKSVLHKNFRIAMDHQGKKIGRKFLENSITLYEKLGVRKVSTMAAGSMGSYVWARMGFLPTHKGWGQLTEVLETRLENLTKQHVIPMNIQENVRKILKNQDPRAIWLLADLSHDIDGLSLGKALLINNAWVGKLELNNKLQMQRFNAYMDEPSTKLEAVNEMWKRKGGYNNKADAGRRRVPDDDVASSLFIPF